MNRIVRNHYPVSKLPEDLRREAAPADYVTVTLESESAVSIKAPVSKRRSRLAELGIDPEQVPPVSISDIRKIATPRGTTVRQAVARVRRLRDERSD